MRAVQPKSALNKNFWVFVDLVAEAADQALAGV
jgi:hypothetical protein